MSKLSANQKFPALIFAICLLACCSNQSETNPESAPSEMERQTAGVEFAMPEPARRAFVRSCAACHGYDGRGIVGVGPDLRRAKPRNPEEWGKYLRDASGAHPATQAPPLWIDDDEIKALALSLSALAQQP